MDRFSDHLGFQASVLGLRSRRNNILASNIANAATPNFKARDFDFARAAEKLDPTGPLTTTNDQHIPAARPVGMRDMQYRVPLNPSYDGNTVELAIEQMQFSENVMRYQTSLNFLNARINGLRSAIRGE